MDDDPSLEAPESPASARKSRRLSVVMLVLGLVALLTVVALVALTIGPAWLHLVGSVASPQELAAKAELTKLGALMAMDAARAHVNSVNLATLKSPDSIDRAVELLPALDQLKSLNVDGTQFRDEHAAVVAQLDSLQDLVLSNTSITDAAIDKLATLPGLATLYLVKTGVTNASLPAIAGMSSLKIIDLSGTKVTGNFEPLKQLSELNWLLLRGLTLDAAAVSAIGNCGSLTRLTLGDAQVPEEAVVQLQRDRPKLKIDR